MHNKEAVLYIFSGLPGTGKTTLATALAKHTGATYLRVDAIEQSLKDILQTDIYDEGYQLAFSLATDCLSQGISVVGDSCNSVSESREAWQQEAIDLGLKFINIEVLCSDDNEHRHRVESRQSSIVNLALPSWQQVQNREFQPWVSEVTTVDTAGKNVQQSKEALFRLLGLQDHLPITHI